MPETPVTASIVLDPAGTSRFVASLVLSHQVTRIPWTEKTPLQYVLHVCTWSEDYLNLFVKDSIILHTCKTKAMQSSHLTSSAVIILHAKRIVFIVNTTHRRNMSGWQHKIPEVEGRLGGTSASGCLAILCNFLCFI